MVERYEKLLQLHPRVLFSIFYFQRNSKKISHTTTLFPVQKGLGSVNFKTREDEPAVPGPWGLLIAHAHELPL